MRMLRDICKTWFRRVCTPQLRNSSSVKSSRICESPIDTSPRHRPVQLFSHTRKPCRHHWDTLKQGAYALCTAGQHAGSRLQHHRWEMRNFEGNWAQWIFTVDQHKVIYNGYFWSTDTMSTFTVFNGPKNSPFHLWHSYCCKGMLRCLFQCKFICSMCRCTSRYTHVHTFSVPIGLLAHCERKHLLKQKSFTEL